MIIFLEEYLQKKIQIAEYLYMYGKDFSREEAIEVVDVSMSTLVQYCNEIQEMYHSVYKNGLVYNSQSLETIVTNLIAQSKKVEVLRLLFLYPGHTSNFYKQKLIISDSSFSRIIAQLKMNLKEFDVYILVKEGYRIQAKNEKYTAVLFTFIGLFYCWSFDELIDRLRSYGGQEIIDELFAIDFSQFTVANDFFEIQFYQTIFVIQLLRQFQQQELMQMTGDKSALEQLSIEDLLNYLSMHLNKAKVHIQKKLPKAIVACFPNGIGYEKRKKIEGLAVRVALHLSLFPYEVNTLPFRMMFFTMKFRMTHKEYIDKIDNFIYRASTYLRINLHQRYEMVFFYVVAEDLLDFRKKKFVAIYLHSSIGDQRRAFYLEKLTPLLGYFSKESAIHMLDGELTEPLPPNSWIITTDYLSDFPLWQQFVISDFLSPTDLLYIMLWLKDGTKKQHSV